MTERFFQALEAHRQARDEAEDKAIAERGPLTRLQRRIIRSRASKKVEPRYQLIAFDCPFCLARKFRWGDTQYEICETCRKWI